ncbi:hypothetical protein TomMM35A_31630 [Sphingobium sp. TomMM35A]
MKSLAQQTEQNMSGAASVLSRQKRDHERLDRLLNRLGAAPADQQAPLLLRIYRLVFPHAFAEEAVLWPTLRRVLPDGQLLTLRVEQEHQQINELVAELDGTAPDSPHHAQLLERIVALLRQDVRDEEDRLLPRLQDAVSPAQLRRLGWAWEAVRRIAPTRAHPIVSRRPPGNVLAALPLSLLDRSRDGIDALLHRGAGPATEPLRALSSALAFASNLVERLPGMRKGEDPSTSVSDKHLPGWRAAAAATVVAGAVLAVRSSRGR